MVQHICYRETPPQYRGGYTCRQYAGGFERAPGAQDLAVVLNARLSARERACGVVYRVASLAQWQAWP